MRLVVEVEVWVVRVETPHSISPHPTVRSPSIVREHPELQI